MDFRRILMLIYLFEYDHLGQGHPELWPLFIYVYHLKLVYLFLLGSFQCFETSTSL